ncbi:MAG: crotonase/enoyl-CoA hydratase family protein [Hyphomonadaceae bacterium]|nr:crotonase/enoyl-CoA hydratase family protein [Hyphomonadaceae bacterium]
MSDLVERRREGPIVTITLNDPERRNGLTPAMIDALESAIAALDRESGVACAILTAAGSAFCAGGDPKRMLAPGPYSDLSGYELRQHYVTGIQRIAWAFQTLETPVIAAINGPAIGAGCDLACMCDLRIAAPEAEFAMSFVKLGLVPGDGGAWFLPRVVGLAKAAELMLTGERIGAEDALRIGLISVIVPGDALLDAARARAQAIASNPPHAVRLTKKLLRHSQELDFAGVLDASASYQAIAQRTEDHQEAVRAFLERRPPVFRGR